MIQRNSAAARSKPAVICRETRVRVYLRSMGARSETIDSFLAYLRRTGELKTCCDLRGIHPYPAVPRPDAGASTAPRSLTPVHSSMELPE